MTTVTRHIAFYITLLFSVFSHASTTWVPINVGDITTFIPYAPSGTLAVPGNAQITSSGGVSTLTWADVEHASQYEIQALNANGQWVSILTTSELSVIIDSRFAGYTSVRVTACTYNSCSNTGGWTAGVSLVDDNEGTDWITLGGESIDDTRTSVITAPTSNFFGAINGNAAVNGGAASYSIPIALPPGRNKIQPNASLNYSSRNGNGLVGVGWGLSAGGAISRCAQTLAQDGSGAAGKRVSYSETDDRLCLNGQRLMVTSGTYGAIDATYATEVDSFLIVTQKDGSINDDTTWFEITYPNGAKKYYGEHLAERVVPTGAPAVLSWLVNREEDFSGNNHITYNYTNYDDGEVLLSNITYTGNGTTDGDRSVEFTYEDRTTGSKGKYSTTYLAGGKTRQTQRLKYISTYIDINRDAGTSTQIRRYALIYKKSTGSGRILLNSVEECAYQGADVCRKKTLFNWSDAKLTYIPEALTTDTGSELYTSTGSLLDNIAEIVPRGDIDGNGSRDWQQHFINAEGESLGVNNFDYTSCIHNFLTSSYLCSDADFNQDGLSDSWRKHNNKLQIGITVKNATTGAVTANWDLPDTVISLASTSSTRNEIIQITDFNDDGWPDVLLKEATYYNLPKPEWRGSIKLYLHSKNINAPYSNGQMVGSFSNRSNVSPIGDINGDGTLDFSVNRILEKDYETMPTMTQIKLLHVDDQNNISMVSHSIDFDANSTDYDYENFSTLIDVNNDGLSDWLGWVPNKFNQLHVRLNKGDGTFEDAQYVGYNLPQRVFTVPGELDGDGIYEGITSYSPKFLGAFKHMDVDGDGTTELIMPGNSSSDMLVEACTQHNNYQGGKYVLTNYCGSAIYGQTTISIGGVPAPGHIASDNDASIYKYKALKFIEHSDGSISATLINTDLVGTPYNSMVVDALGNGLSDLVFTYGCSKNFRCNIDPDGATGVMDDLPIDKVYFSRNYGATTHSSPTKDQYQPVDMLNSVNNGIGIVSQWQYRPLSSDTVADFYQREAGSVDSEHFYFASSMYAVSAFSQSNGVGTSNTRSYQYDSAMYNIEGRGFRGFKKITETDHASRRVIATEFEQLFPYSSLVKRQTVSEIGADTPFSVSTNQWQLNTSHQTSRGDNGLYHFYNGQSRSITCEVGATSCVWKSTLSSNLSQREVVVDSDDIDEYGNVTQRTATLADAYGTHTTVTSADYDDASDAWPHQLTSTTVTKSIVQGTGRASTTSDNGNGTVDTNTTKTLTTHIKSYDSIHRKPTDVYISAGSTPLSSCASNLACSHTSTTYNTYGLPSSMTQSAEVLSGVNQTQVNQIRRTFITYTHGSTVAADGYFPFSVSKTVGGYSHQTTMHVNPATGQATQNTDVSGVTSTTSYDALGRPIKIVSAGYPNKYIAYKSVDANSPSHAVMMVETTQAGAATTAVYKNSFGKALRTRTQDFVGSHVFSDVRYDALGQKTHESAPYTTTAIFTQYSYDNTNDQQDVLGRLHNKITPTVNGTLNTTYSYSGLTTTISVVPTVGETLEMTRSYNSLEQLVETSDANDNITAYVYDGAGNPIVIQDVAGNSIYALYDDLGRKQWVDDPNQGKTDFIYNGFGELENETDANNHTIDYDMDSAGRITHRYSSDNSAAASFVFDTNKIGLLTSHSQGSINKTFSYDDKARVIASTITIDGQAYTTETAYDSHFGRPTLLRYPNQLSIAYQYNKLGYLTTETNAASGYVYRTVTAQDVWGNITQASLGNTNITTDYSFSNISGQMLSANATGTILGSTGQIQTISYSDFDSYGNLKEQRRSDNGVNSSANYTYDKLHRLTQTSRNVSGTTLNIDYGYDAAGNFTKKTDFSSNSNSAYQYHSGTNKLSQVTKRDNTLETYRYDNKGNLTHRNDQQESTYNVFNKPLTINRKGATMAFTYGADLARYKQVRNETGTAITTHYIDKHYEVELENNTKRWKAYLSDVAIVSDTLNTTGNKKISFTLRERLGSAVTFADHNGATTARRYFDPFGKPLGGDWSDLTALTGASTLANNPLDSDMPTRRGFTDHEHLDKAELIHMNGRVYDYNLGRFLSVDPVIVSPENSQSLNPYSYIMNNPLSGTDPTGYSEVKEEKTKTTIVSTTGSNIKRRVTSTVKSDGNGGASVTISGGNGAARSAVKAAITGNLTGAGFKVTDIGSQGNVDIGSHQSTNGGGGQGGGDSTSGRNNFGAPIRFDSSPDGKEYDFDPLSSFKDFWDFTDVSAEVMIESSKNVAEEALDVLDMATMVPSPGSGAVVVAKGTVKGAMVAGVMMRKAVVAASIKWKGFTKGQLRKHFEKHVLKQGEFGNISQAEYLKQAKVFARESGSFNEASVGNFIIKHDPNSGRVLVGHAKSREIRTFYRDDGRSANAFQSAIDTAKGL